MINDQPDGNTFVFTCHRCKSPLFQLKHGGIAECMHCSRTYAYISAAQTWVPLSMDAETYLEKYLHKAWDEDKKQFRLIEDIKKDRESKKISRRKINKKGDKK